MSGKAKIEGLTNSWYGFAVFSAICSVLMNGIGILSVILAIGGLLFSWFITFLIGRALIKKSSLTRFLLLVISGIVTIVGTIGTGKAALSFVQHWQLSVLAYGAYTAVSTWMHARSFRTLMNGSVKAHFN